MYLFYSYEQIQALSIFSSIDFSVFTGFEIVVITILFNLFYLACLSFFVKVAYKTVNRILNIIF